MIWHVNRRFPKRRNPRSLTSRHLQDILPTVLREVNQLHAERPDLVLSGWQQVVGPNLEGMTEAVSFFEGVLLVKVKNSTLHSLLHQYEKRRLLRELRQKFPRVDIKNIVFRVG